MALVVLAAATAAPDPTRARGKCNPEIAGTDWHTLRNITSVPDWRVLPGDIADANKTLDGLYHEVACRLAAADGPLTLFIVGDSTMATQLAHLHFAIRWEVERQSLAGTTTSLTSCTTPCSELAPGTVSFGDISNFNIDECFLEAGETIDHGLYQANGRAPGPPIEALAVGDAELAGKPYSTAGSLVSAGVLEIGRLRATIGGKAISVVSVISRRSIMTMPQAASMLDVLRSAPYSFEELEKPLLAYVQAFGMHHMHSGSYVDFEHKAPLAAVPGYRARLQAGLEGLDHRAAPGSTIVLMTTHAVCETGEVARYKRECAKSSEACETVCKEATPDDQKPFATPLCSFGSPNGTADPKMVLLYEHSLSSGTGSNRLAWNERDVLAQRPSLAGVLDAHTMTLDKCNHSSDGRHYDITVVHAEVVELLSRFQLPPRPRGASQRHEAVPSMCAVGGMGEEKPAAVALSAQSVMKSAQTAQAAPPAAARCLRSADHDFNRWFAEENGRAGRKATDADCSYACSAASSEHHTWCVGFEFKDTETGMCELYDDCSQAAQAAQAAPPAAVRCLRVADHEFDRWFVEKNGRKATEADCSLACNNASSAAGEAAKEVAGEAAKEWCVGFEFRRTETGMCELYDDCSQQRKQQKEQVFMAAVDLKDLGLVPRQTREERLKAVSSMVQALSAAPPDSTQTTDEQRRANAEINRILGASSEATPEGTPTAQQAADKQAAEEARDTAETAAVSAAFSASHSVASPSPASSWTLDPRVYEDPGQFIGCPDGQRNAAESECLAAVEEATRALGLVLQGRFVKVVDNGADGWVPFGCSFSRGHGLRAMFNRNLAGRSSGSYPLVCIKDEMQIPVDLAPVDHAPEASDSPSPSAVGAPAEQEGAPAEQEGAPAEQEGAPAEQEGPNREPSTGGQRWFISKGQPSPLDDAEALRIMPGEQLRNAQQEQQAHFDAWEDAPRPWEEKTNASSADAIADSSSQLHQPAVHALALGEPEQEQAHFEAWEDAVRPWNGREETPTHSGHTAAAVRTVSALAEHSAEHPTLLRPPTRAAFARDYPYDPYLQYRHLAPQNI